MNAKAMESSSVPRMENMLKPPSPRALPSPNVNRKNHTKKESPPPRSAEKIIELT